jgi:periplasmic protein TonB
MFELFGAGQRRAARGGTTPLLISTATHLIVVAVLVIVPLTYVSTDLPAVPDMLAFVVSAAPPPPPPPPAPPALKPAKASVVKSQLPARVQAAPVQAPTAIVEEAVIESGTDDGVPGGVEGGVPGGVVGGIVGGLLTTALPPKPLPPPPRPVVERAPVRIGGELTAPALLERAEPDYPPFAVRAQVQGTVILEAVVDRNGRVEDVRVLRSIPLLDSAAVAAVRKWRYSPLLLNGQPERFVLTVTVSFSLAA